MEWIGFLIELISCQCERYVMEVSLTCSISGSHDVSTHIWEQSSREDTDDRDHDHELHEGESFRMFYPSISRWSKIHMFHGG
jgi:hypothetical protein